MLNAVSKNLQLVIFDMIGTTIIDNGVILESFEKTLDEFNIMPSAKQLETFRGYSKKEAIRLLLANNLREKQESLDSKAEAIYERFRTMLLQGYKREKIKEIEGTQGIFDALNSKKIKIALTTGLDSVTKGMLIKKLGWDSDLIDVSVCVDDVSKGRPAPYLNFKAMEKTGTISVHNVVTVGDTIQDLLAARNAGIEMSFGVLSGAHDKKHLGKYPHIALIESVKKLPEYLF